MRKPDLEDEFVSDFRIVESFTANEALNESFLTAHYSIINFSATKIYCEILAYHVTCRVIFGDQTTTRARSMRKVYPSIDKSEARNAARFIHREGFNREFFVESLVIKQVSFPFNNTLESIV